MIVTETWSIQGIVLRDIWELKIRTSYFTRWIKREVNACRKESKVVIKIFQSRTFRNNHEEHLNESLLRKL